MAYYDLISENDELWMPKTFWNGSLAILSTSSEIIGILTPACAAG